MSIVNILLKIKIFWSVPSHAVKFLSHTVVFSFQAFNFTDECWNLICLGVVIFTRCLRWKKKKIYSTQFINGKCYLFDIIIFKLLKDGIYSLWSLTILQKSVTLWLGEPPCTTWREVLFFPLEIICKRYVIFSTIHCEEYCL